jgi:hypothetical protein
MVSAYTRITRNSPTEIVYLLAQLTTEGKALHAIFTFSKALDKCQIVQSYIVQNYLVHKLLKTMSISLNVE